MNSLDENTVNAPADDKFEVEVSVQRAPSSWESLQSTLHPFLSAVVPRAPGTPCVLYSAPLNSPQLLGRTGAPALYSVPIPSDHAFLLQQVKMQPTDPTDKEALVAALDLKEPTKTAYLNTTFTTTDL